MTTQTLLNRLTRVKQLKPYQWKAACPCCESRKGYPLTITERDGKTLLHAFCGCETASVLGRLGLTVSDLFDRPLEHRSEPKPNRLPAAEVLSALSTEATVLAVLAADFLQKRSLNEEDWQRLATCAQRIGAAADHVRGR